MMDKVRGEFEEFAAKMDLDTSYVVGEEGEFVEYFDHNTKTSWTAWKASKDNCGRELEAIKLQKIELIVALKTAKGFIEQAIDVSGFGEYTLGVVNDAIRKAEGDQP
jgi:hypothetical protein